MHGGLPWAIGCLVGYQAVVRMSIVGLKIINLRSAYIGAGCIRCHFIGRVDVCFRRMKTMNSLLAEAV